MKDYEVANLISPSDKAPELSPQNVLERRWAHSLARFLPMVSENPFWRFSRTRSELDASFGWKIHISATILNACSIVRAVGPALVQNNILFKAPSTLSRLRALNSGVVFGYSQIGKLITVFPKSEREFLDLLHILEPLLRHWWNCPAVPFDIRFGRTCIYYRYGSFTNAEDTIPAIGDRGWTIRDTRDARMLEYAVKNDPARAYHPPSRRTSPPFPARYLVCEALSQRGKGGVYSAIDVSSSPPRQCVIKEGRLNGETTWSGRDGRRLIQNEERVLKLLRDKLPVPRILDSFESGGNYYLVLEQIEGTRLDRLELRRLTIYSRLELGKRLSAIVETIHGCGWIWRDCKPQNLLVATNGTLRPIDFEGACPVDSPDPEAWSTLTVVNNSGTARADIESSMLLDLHQLAVCLSWLLLDPDNSRCGQGDLVSRTLSGAIIAMTDPGSAEEWSAAAISELISLELYRLAQSESRAMS